MTKTPRALFLFGFLAYILLVVTFFFPILKDPSGILFGAGGDAFGLLNQLWRNANGYFHLDHNPLICAPFGVTPPYASIQPLYDFFLFQSARFFGDIAGFNFLVLVSFPLSAFSAFVFFWYLSKEFFPSWVGGLSFGFSTFSITHAAVGHLTFSLNFFLPLFLLSLFFHRRHHSFFSSFLLGLVYAGLFLLSTYWGYFCFFLGTAFFLFDLFSAPKNNKLSLVGSYMWTSGIALLLLFWGWMPFLKDMFYRRGSDGGISYIRQFEELKMYAAYPWEYFLPSVHHPLWGGITETFFQVFLHASNVFEQSFYLGGFTIVLWFCGWRLVLKEESAFDRKSLVALVSVLSFVMLLLSFPPYVPLGDLIIPNFSYFLFQIVPLFRVYARASVLVHLLLIAGAVIFFSYFQSKYPVLKKSVIRFALVVIVLFDMWSLSPSYFQKLQTPEVYKWLGEQPKDGLVVEYPMTVGDSLPFYRYLFWQRVHGWPLVNGAMPFHREAWALFEKVNDFQSPDTKVHLQNAGVRYVILHTTSYAEGPILSSLKRYYPPSFSAKLYNNGKIPSTNNWGKPIKKIGGDWVFQI